MEVTSLSSGACKTTISAPTTDNKHPTFPIEPSFSFRNKDANIALVKHKVIRHKYFSVYVEVTQVSRLMLPMELLIWVVQRNMPKSSEFHRLPL